MHALPILIYPPLHLSVHSLKLHVSPLPSQHGSYRPLATVPGHSSSPLPTVRLQVALLLLQILHIYTVDVGGVIVDADLDGVGHMKIIKNTVYNSDNTLRMLFLGYCGDGGVLGAWADRPTNW